MFFIHLPISYVSDLCVNVGVVFFFNVVPIIISFFDGLFPWVFVARFVGVGLFDVGDLELPLRPGFPHFTSACERPQESVPKFPFAFQRVQNVVCKV